MSLGNALIIPRRHAATWFEAAVIEPVFEIVRARFETDGINFGGKSPASEAPAPVPQVLPGTRLARFRKLPLANLFQIAGRCACS